MQRAQRLGRWTGVRGIITLAFGVLFLARPGAGVGLLIATFGVFCFVDGFIALGAAFGGSAMRSRVVLAIEGLLSIGAGVLTFAMPGKVAFVVLLVIAVRALIIGAVEIVGAMRLGHAIPNPWLLALTGLVSMAFGVLLLRNPEAGLLAMAWLVGAYGVVLGLAQIGAAMTLGSAIKHTTPLRPTIAHS